MPSQGYSPIQNTEIGEDGYCVDPGLSSPDRAPPLAPHLLTPKLLFFSPGSALISRLLLIKLWWWRKREWAR